MTNKKKSKYNAIFDNANLTLFLFSLFSPLIAQSKYLYYSNKKS